MTGTVETGSKVDSNSDVRSPANRHALHKHALAMLETADMALAHTAGLELDGPWRDTDVTVAFLQENLADSVSGAMLESATLAESHDGMTQRRRWQLAWNSAGHAAGLPAAVFVKATPEEAYLRETLSMLHMAENEVRFYNELQPDLRDISPRAWFARSYPGGRFLLVMEVLEDRGLQPFWQADDCSLQHAYAVVTALAQLHASYWETPRFANDLAWVRPRTLRFGFEWHQRSFTTARKTYLEQQREQSLPPEVGDLVSLWDSNDRAVYAYWDSLPATVLHGDSHLGNTYAAADGSAGFFDWQVIYRGHGLRDVNYFILAALDNTTRRQHERALFNHYLAELAEREVELSPDTAWRDYRLFTLDIFDAHMKTVTRGGYGHGAKGLSRGRECLMGALLDHDVIGLLRNVIDTGNPAG
jgi:hypothetical protein